MTYCVHYVRPPRGKHPHWRKWGEFTTTGTHIAGCFDDLDDAIRRLQKLQDKGKCRRFCAIYEREGNRQRMFWPKVAKRWRTLY